MDKPERPPGMNGDFLHLHKMIEWLADEVKLNRQLTDGLYKVILGTLGVVVAGLITILGILITIILGSD